MVILAGSRTRAVTWYFLGRLLVKWKYVHYRNYITHDNDFVNKQQQTLTCLVPVVRRAALLPQ